jgi:hypothetical protein
VYRISLNSPEISTSSIGWKIQHNQTFEFMLFQMNFLSIDLNENKNKKCWTFVRKKYTSMKFETQLLHRVEVNDARESQEKKHRQLLHELHMKDTFNKYTDIENRVIIFFHFVFLIQRTNLYQTLLIFRSKKRPGLESRIWWKFRATFASAKPWKEKFPNINSVLTIEFQEVTSTKSKIVVHDIFDRETCCWIGVRIVGNAFNEPSNSSKTKSFCQCVLDDWDLHWPSNKKRKQKKTREQKIEKFIWSTCPS